ncbi:MAG: hypothetical protein AAF039_09140 [Bacteroidota bacterium]
MNRKHIVFSVTLLFGVYVWAQETKTYKETFGVGEGAILEIKASHTDIEFETWEKNQVEIVATVTLDEATKEEAEEYFKKEPFKIMGNSQEIEVSSLRRNSWDFALAGSDFDFHFDVEPLFLDLEIPDLPELAVIPELAVMPPLPPMNFKSFDYGRYKDEGSEYLQEWAEGFQEGFNEEYQEKMKEWGKRVEERAKAWEERNAERLRERERMMEERAKELEKRAEERAKRVEERAKERKERIKARGEENRGLFFSGDDDSNIFFFSSDGENKKYKVKKTIKIKMPKSVKLKMNVKHGEVKLAGFTRDINASLRYASLLASTIDGQNTEIKASYSPIVVQNWNLGNLKADYSDKINLKEVGELKLNAVNSNVTIENLRNKVFVTNNLGKLAINHISSGFSDVDVNVQNGEVFCKIPSTPISFYLNGTKSKIAYPAYLVMERNVNFDNTVHKGFQGQENSGRLITINSKYSEVVIKE